MCRKLGKVIDGSFIIFSLFYSPIYIPFKLSFNPFVLVTVRESIMKLKIAATILLQSVKITRGYNRTDDFQNTDNISEYSRATFSYCNPVEY
jgi:hypothetical protein